MKKQPKSNDPNLLTAKEAADVLNVSRGQIERFQILGDLKPVSTPYSLYYFSKEEVIELKEKIAAEELS